MNKKVIYTSGMPRSNSTLIVNLLGNNPDFGGGETSPLLEYLYGSKKNYSSVPEVKSALTKDIMHESFLNFCRAGVDGYAKSVDSKKIYIDKSRGWIHYAPFLWEINPDAKIIVMVRDIRAVLSSFEKKWRENPAIIDSNDNPSEQSFITIDQRVNTWLSSQPLGISLKRLFNAIQTKTIENMLVVKAEELSKNPKGVMQKVYEFIEEPYYDLDYNNVKQITVENDRTGANGIYGDHMIRPKVEPLKKDYDEILGKELANSVKENYKWFYKEFNYF